MRRLLTFTLVLLLCLQCGRREAGAPAPQPGSVAERFLGEALGSIGERDLPAAERLAYAAALAAKDSAEMDDAVSLLGYVYILEGKDAEAKMLMGTVKPDGMMRYMRMQERQRQQAQTGQRWGFVAVVVALLAVLLATVAWHRRRTDALRLVFQSKVEELVALAADRSQPTGDARAPAPLDLATQIGQTKQGVDVLYAILHDENISQMGRREQAAVLQTVAVLDPPLGDMLAQVPLTPKETFFCIMEHYGKTDQQKARSFCCSEQAIRSTKSRLGKKTELSKLRR